MGLLDQLKTAFAGKNRKVDIRSRFELLREAISGTMSKFYMARDKQSDQVVGLKVLDREKTKAFEARFPGMKKPTEGEISVKLKHPNIVETFEHGLTTKGEQFLVMEFIEGPGLNSLLIGESNRKMLEGTRVPLIRQIASALEAVHKAEFIHRDVCPRNVMVEPNSGVLKLIDFGLSIPAKPEFLAPGNRTGNPNYMAPELVRRRATDERVDIFAFGVTAYEICAVALPWPRGMTGKAAMDHATRPPTPLREHCPQINSKLAAAIEWCLVQDPKDRCRSMTAFLQKIQSVRHEYEE